MLYFAEYVPNILNTNTIQQQQQHFIVLSLYISWKHNNNDAA